MEWDEIWELYDSLKEMEEEYDWTQDPELKLRMLETARQINDLLLDQKYDENRRNW